MEFLSPSIPVKVDIVYSARCRFCKAPKFMYYCLLCMEFGICYVRLGDKRFKS